jgi:hypothetical protein
LATIASQPTSLGSGPERIGAALGAPAVVGTFRTEGMTEGDGLGCWPVQHATSQATASMASDWNAGWRPSRRGMARRPPDLGMLGASGTTRAPVNGPVVRSDAV